MEFSSFLYRQKQRYKYHTTKDPFIKKVAEINRFTEEVKLNTSSFEIKGFDFNFKKHNHQFIIDGLDLFRHLSKNTSGVFKLEDENLYFLINGLKLSVQTAEELFILNEIFFEQCYNFILPYKEVIVIDIGMNVGYASLYFANKPEVKKVYSFEPFEETFKNAIENIEQNPTIKSKIIAHNYGWSKINKNLTTSYSSDKKGRNSIILNFNKKEKTVNIVLHEAKEQLLEIINDNKDAQFIIKMDCEGAEHEIFDSLYPIDLPQQIVGIVLEWHFTQPDSIITYLSKNQFKIFNTTLGKKTGLIYGFR